MGRGDALIVRCACASGRQKKIAHGERGRWRLALEERGGWARRFSQDPALSLRQLSKIVNRCADSDCLAAPSRLSSCR